MNKANLWTILVGIALVVLPQLLTQTDVPLPPIAKELVQLSILAVGVIARYLPSNSEPTKVELSVAPPADGGPV